MPPSPAPTGPINTLRQLILAGDGVGVIDLLAQDPPDLAAITDLDRTMGLIGTYLSRLRIDQAYGPGEFSAGYHARMMKAVDALLDAGASARTYVDPKTPAGQPLVALLSLPISRFGWTRMSPTISKMIDAGADVSNAMPVLLNKDTFWSTRTATHHTVLSTLNDMDEAVVWLLMTRGAFETALKSLTSQQWSSWCRSGHLGVPNTIQPPDHHDPVMWGGPSSHALAWFRAHQLGCIPSACWPDIMAHLTRDDGSMVRSAHEHGVNWMADSHQGPMLMQWARSLQTRSITSNQVRALLDVCPQAFEVCVNGTPVGAHLEQMLEAGLNPKAIGGRVFPFPTHACASTDDLYAHQAELLEDIRTIRARHALQKAVGPAGATTPFKRM